MMLFRIEAGDEIVYDPTLIQNERLVLSPKLTLELGKAGSLSFTMPPDNVGYNSITKLKTIVRVYRNGELIFKGRVLEIERDFYNRKRVYCEGMLAFLNDANIEPFAYPALSPYDFMSTVIDLYNGRVMIDLSKDDVTVPDKMFNLGTVNVEGAGPIERDSTEYVPALDLLTSELTDKYGGYFRVREEIESGSRVNYIDYLTAYDQVAIQQIEFGKNLLDITEYITAEDVFTVLVPLGEQIKDTDGNIVGRLDITDLPDVVYEGTNNDPIAYKSGDRLVYQTGVNLFGRIEKVQVWDDVTNDVELLANGQLVLKKGVESNIKLTLSAVDLNLIDNDVEAYELGDIVRVLSEPHGIDMLFQITKMDIDMANPADTTYEFSADYDQVPEPQLEQLRSGETASTMDTTTRDSSPTGGYKLSKGVKTASTTITEKTIDGKKSTDKVAIRIVEVQNTKIVSTDISSGAVIESKIHSDAVTEGKIKDGAVTPAKLSTDDMNDWLTKINSILDQSTSAYPITIGSGSMHTTAAYVSFNASDNGYVRLYHNLTQVEEITSHTNHYALVVFRTSGGNYYALCIGSDGILQIVNPDS